ncbi:DUF2505 domain-containing protein [Amycolatopsis rhizosphaerae]|uniref:DUF2505 domain-containing protein n=1 Tax=Amycolatopsis rhizosphaerae TaxID=2053003 RepID=A0A558ADL7_9PSEU|nr:DUF2505 domain-containing protein [Amycolatopsis rhizosphaerae]TVT22368.1 DUF2505 domain-containing protein [Amycolatopsis rhizosphaerae]
MASRIEHRAEFVYGVTEVFAAQSSEPAVRARLSEIGGDHAALLDYSAAPDSVRFHLRQGVGADKLPSVVRALHHGDLFVDRHESWTISEGRYSGIAKATVSGLPGEITARTELLSRGEGTLLEITGEVKIRIPLVGGKLEGFVAEQVTHLLAREAEYSAQWLAENS